ncbi:MAG: hypothetical protein MUE44_02515 [Oscillatoriaceae cyanobacterium Prado104]|jgi:hypothetical protein|nr:hypothetical protein [Oscillatoriaceae cyanobacterium Prado104]
MSTGGEHMSGQLLLATGVGIGVMVLVYRALSWNWRLLRSNLEQFWDGPNRRLVLASGSGALATVLAYMTLAIWADSESPWIACNAILQNLATIAIAVLLWCQPRGQSTLKDEAVLDRILADLTALDPVKRLIAVRQITNLVSNPEFGKQNSLKSSIAAESTVECFRLMLSREPEVFVRNALLEGLQTLDSLTELSQTNLLSLADAAATGNVDIIKED